MKTAISLTAAQQQAVDSDSPLILCCAGAGAGKTKTLVERIRRLVLAMHDPAGMVAITFTQAAAQELKDRLEGITLQYVGTLHGYLLRLIQTHGSKIGFNGAVGVLDTDQAQTLLDQVVKDLAYKGTKKDLEAALKGVGLAGRAMPYATIADMVAAAFFRRLRQANLVTFDTILEYGLKLAGHVENAEFLFVDEHQDSSDLDAEIYAALPFANKFYVGDADQSIFSFRGSAVQNFIDLGRTADLVIRLEENFRSDRLICSAANRLIEHNQNRIKKTTVSVADAGGTVHAVRHRNASAELSWLADLLSDQDGPQCAVLARSNALVDSVAQHLTGLGIAVAKRQKPERPQDWETARALLLVLNDPENDLLAGWLLARKSGQASALKLEATAKGLSLNQHAIHLPAVTPVSDVPTVMARAGISREAVGFVEELIGRSAPVTIAELLLGLAADDQKERQISPGIVVTTVHKAKGTEFDTVVIVGCEEPGFPTGQASKAGPEAVEEERRLMFVAMTRSRHSLYLSHCYTRVPEWGPKVGQPRQPSRFLREAGLIP